MSTKFYNNVKDLVFCGNDEVSKEISKLYVSKGHSVSVSNVQINIGTHGDVAVKRLEIFEIQKKFINDSVIICDRHLNDRLKSEVSEIEALLSENMGSVSYGSELNTPKDYDSLFWPLLIILSEDTSNKHVLEMISWLFDNLSAVKFEVIQHDGSTIGQKDMVEIRFTPNLIYYNNGDDYSFIRRKNI